ncbi:MAG: nuclear transport factor 2 family protein [Ferruginibacter sp.]
MLKIIGILFCVVFSSTAISQVQDTLFTEALVKQELGMFNAISQNDSAYLQKLMADDFVSINADGKMADKTSTLKNLSKFKGATFKLTNKAIRMYENTGIINGRAKFYFRSLLVADVWYTEVWRNENGTWRYNEWQGTMTGWPSFYPVIVTIISIFLLWLIFMFVFKNRRKKTF